MVKRIFFLYIFFVSLAFASCTHHHSIRKDLSDDQLLNLVQKQTFRYFWDFGDPVSGLARERSNTVHYGITAMK
jgi:hypothetical protein